jgi:Family of unknown function (DUF5343)
MAETAKTGAPPYATWAAFLNFLNKLRDTTIPSRIDPTVFGNASGSVTYSIIAALKFLKLINAEGDPSPLFLKLVKASDEDRKAVMAGIIKANYPTLFGGKIDITKATAGQFDEHIRDTYDAQGSTVDKIAAFFIAASQYAAIDLSPHIKARKPTAASASAGKSRKQRRTAGDEPEDRDPPPALTPSETKALEYQLIDLMKVEGIGQPEQDAIWTLVRFLTTKKAED